MRKSRTKMPERILPPGAAMQLPPSRPGPARAVTLQDIASRCGVTKITVSRALRHDTHNVSEETIARILEVAREMGYNPTLQHAARRLAMNKHGQDLINQVIALFFPPNFQEIGYFSAMFKGILDELMPRGYGLLTHQLFRERDGNKEYLLPPIFERGDVDGVISMLPLGGFHDALEQIRNMATFGDRPVVSLIEPLEGCSNVLTDDFSGGHLATGRLLDAGHRHLLHSCYPIYPHQQRLAGYRQACFDRGLDPDAVLHFCEWDLYSVVKARADLLAAMRAHPEITAILAPNDVFGMQMIELLAQEGLHVPEKISLIGYDDTETLADAGGRNILTTVRQPLVEVGREAARLIIRRVTGEMPQDVSLVLPVSFIDRGTVLPPAVRQASPVY